MVTVALEVKVLCENLNKYSCGISEFTNKSQHGPGPGPPEWRRDRTRDQGRRHFLGLGPDHAPWKTPKTRTPQIVWRIYWQTFDSLVNHTLHLCFLGSPIPSCKFGASIEFLFLCFVYLFVCFRPRSPSKEVGGVFKCIRSTCCIEFYVEMGKTVGPSIISFFVSLRGVLLPAL